MDQPAVTPPPPRDRRVTFPDLVRIHYRWRKMVAADSTATAEEREAADAAYHAALEKFEHEHGELISAYWCADFESGVALTAGRPHNSRLRRLLSVSPKFHRVSDWATKDDPEVARLLHKCDELAIRAAEVLRGRSRRICIQLVMTSACHLLSLVDARQLRQSDEDIARGYTLFLGGLRPVLGSIFGLLTYFAITSNFVEVFRVPAEGIKQFYFLCVIAFAAGFSERWAQDTLTGGLTGRGRGATPAKPAAKPAAKAAPKAGSTSAAGAAAADAGADADGAVD
jgi:hypothetical protein